MNKEIINPSQINEVGVACDAYNLYFQRILHPTQVPVSGPIINGFDCGKVRWVDTHQGYPAINLAKNVVKEELFDYENFRVTRFYSELLKEPSTTIFFIHGGNFFKGNTIQYSNVCRYFADSLNANVFSIDYTLSPETSYPTALKQCYWTIENFVKEKDKFFIDENKVIVMGDSAGGNLAAVCSLLDKENNYIKMQILYYPVVDLTVDGSDCDFASFENGNNIVINERISNLTKSYKLTRDLYLQHNENPADELISPLFTKDFSNTPKTLVIASQFDYLTKQIEQYVQKLHDNNVNYQYYLMKGNFHGFIEKVGILEASKVSMDMCIQYINNNF